MDQIKRIKLLSLVVIGLAFLTAASYLLPMLNSKREGLPDIALQDGLAGLSGMTYTYKGKTHTLAPSKSGDEWFIDKSYPIRDQFLALIQTGFSRLKAKRVLSKEFVKQADSLFAVEGVEVTWTSAEAQGQFMVVGNPNDPNSSYYRAKALGNETYVAFVPGFTGDISNIFELQPGEWRKKTILTSTNRTLQSISLNYPGKAAESFILQFINGDYQVIDVPQIDSTKLYTYMEAYEQLSVDKYLSATDLDSVKAAHKTDVIAQLDIKLLDAQASRSLDIYRLAQDASMVLVYIRPQNEWALMKSKRLFPLLVKKSFFVKK
jgi:hypothetical protein